jgi:hypothetical protein
MATAPRRFDQPVYVTRPLRRPLDAYAAWLGQVWDASWPTSDYAQHRAPETALVECLYAPRLSLVASGTPAPLGDQAMDRASPAVHRLID